MEDRRLVRSLSQTPRAKPIRTILTIYCHKCWINSVAHCVLSFPNLAVGKRPEAGCLRPKRHTEVSPCVVGLLIALFERAVGFCASLIKKATVSIVDHQLCRTPELIRLQMELDREMKLKPSSGYATIWRPTLTIGFGQTTGRSTLDARYQAF